MKQRRWGALETMLAGYGFFKTYVDPKHKQTIWFSSKSSRDASITTNLRFSYKSKLQILTLDVGWTQEETHRFVIQALMDSWPSGFDWFSEVGLVRAPSMLLFNLGDEMGWRLTGMPVGGSDKAFERELEELGCRLVGAELCLDAAPALLKRYFDDGKPFAWSSSNSALRIAEIAGLLWASRGDLDLFDSAASHHIESIERDMYGMGSAQSWTASLRTLAALDKGVNPPD